MKYKQYLLTLNFVANAEAYTVLNNRLVFVSIREKMQ